MSKLRRVTAPEDRERLTAQVVETARAERVRREELELAQREEYLIALRRARDTEPRPLPANADPLEIVLP